MNKRTESVSAILEGLNLVNEAALPKNVMNMLSQKQKKGLLRHDVDLNNAKFVKVSGKSADNYKNAYLRVYVMKDDTVKVFKRDFRYYKDPIFKDSWVRDRDDIEYINSWYGLTYEDGDKLPTSGIKEIYVAVLSDKEDNDSNFASMKSKAGDRASGRSVSDAPETNGVKKDKIEELKKIEFELEKVGYRLESSDCFSNFKIVPVKDNLPYIHVYSNGETKIDIRNVLSSEDMFCKTSIDVKKLGKKLADISKNLDKCARLIDYLNKIDLDSFFIDKY